MLQRNICKDFVKATAAAKFKKKTVKAQWWECDGLGCWTSPLAQYHGALSIICINYPYL